MCACERITASIARGSTPRFLLFSIDSLRRPWNIPQSRRMFECLVRMTCFDPVTVWAAPTNSICIWRGYREKRFEEVLKRFRARGILTRECVTVREEDRAGAADAIEVEPGRSSAIFALVSD